MTEPHFQPAPPTRVRYRVLGFACSLAMITYLDRVCFGAAAPLIADELGLPGVSGLKGAFTAFAIAYAVFEIPAGWVGDRLGPRGTLLRIVAWWSVCTALTGLAGLRAGGVLLGGVTTLAVLRFLFGVGEAGAFPNITRALHNWFPPARWATAQGFVWMSGRLAGGVTPLVWVVVVGGTAYTPPLATWRGAFVLFGLVGLAWCVAFARWFRNRPADHPGVNPAERGLIGERELAGEHSGIPWRSLAGSRSVWALCVMYLCINYGWAFHITYLPDYLKQAYGVPDGSLLGAVYKGGPLWVGAAGCVLGGFLAARVGRKRLAVAALSACAGCWLLAARAPDEHYFFLAASAAAFCTDLTLGAAWATCQDIGRRHAAVTAATMNTVGTFGTAAASWVTGSIVERAVAARPEAEKLAATVAGYQDSFLAYAAVYLVAAGCWLLVNPDRPIEE